MKLMWTTICFVAAFDALVDAASAFVTSPFMFWPGVVDAGYAATCLYAAIMAIGLKRRWLE